MLKRKVRRHWLKYCLALTMCIGIRMIPWKLPNFEPILATSMPFSEKFGPSAGFFFAVLSIVLFDITTNTVSMWTPITGSVYGIVAIIGWYFLKNNRGRTRGYVLYSIIGTLIFDSITGLAVYPIFFHEPFMIALTGQIPFTLYHLLGNLFLSLTLSPAVYRWIIMNKRLESDWMFRRRRPSLQ